METSIIIPAVDEPYLPVLMEEIKKILGKQDGRRGHSYEIIVAAEPGLGYAIRNAFDKTKGEKIIVMDGDGQHNPRYLPAMICLLDFYDIVIGTRVKDERGVFRKIVTSVMTFYVRMRHDLSVKDPLTGYFGLKKSILQDVELHTHGFKVLLEILLKSENESVIELPITFEKRKSGRSKASMKEVKRIVMDRF